MENEQIQQFVLNANNSQCRDHHYWFGLISNRGYMWYSGTGSNVSYRNFDQFETNYLEEQRCQFIQVFLDPFGCSKMSKIVKVFTFWLNIRGKIIELYYFHINTLQYNTLHLLKILN
jgi:hypothetical protein